MKTPRISVVVAAMKAEVRILEHIVSIDEVSKRIGVLKACIEQLEPNGDTTPSAPKVTRTRKPKAAEAEPTL